MDLGKLTKFSLRIIAKSNNISVNSINEKMIWLIFLKINFQVGKSV